MLPLASYAQEEVCTLPGADRNLAKANAFLVDNKNKDGVITTESGLQYKIIKAGKGEKHPRSRDMVSAHYTLTNLAGEKLDSSHDRHMPLQFVVTSVIAGWQEALQLMTEGQHIQLFVPPNLAYRCKGSPPVIGPNELLIFDMELIAIVR
jgi:FKBP-type peptidyl-prolyl cis-trans isomerase